MTPCNIVNMALIKGLHIIAVTDHNSAGNVRAVMEAAKDTPLTVIPGMEVTTAEEVHVVCYFPSVEAAEKMWEHIKENTDKIKNRPEIFGNQYYMDSEDNVVGEEEYLLVSATRLSIEEVFEAADRFGGVALPAHIDRQSYSVLSNLGFIPPDLPVKAVEITEQNREVYEKEYGKYVILTNSDAHNLGDISEPCRSFSLEENKIDNFFKIF